MKCWRWECGEVFGARFDQRREGSIRCERLEDADNIAVLIPAVRNFSDFEILISKHLRKALGEMPKGWVQAFDGKRGVSL